MGDALRVRDLTVHYGRRAAVLDFSLELAPGEIVGLLGPNGAGKSTSLLAMAGGVLPTAGAVEIAGHDLAKEPLEAKRKLGFADQPPSLYEFFTVREHLGFVAEARGRSKTESHDQLLTRLGLASIADRMCRELSFGMRQRVGLAASLVAAPNVVLLDETLNGLDPRAAVQARNVLSEASSNGQAILMSTHLLGVAERLCHRIVIMDRGRVQADIGGDELEELVAGGPGALEKRYLETVVDPDSED